MELLVSVANRHEAQIALDEGVSWIDLKNPSAGSLGAPSQREAEEVAQALAMHSNRSVALGELSGTATPICIAATFPTAKVGLAGEIDSKNWQERFCKLAQKLRPSTELIPVYYADQKRAKAPSFSEVLGVAAHTQATYLLVDTFSKDGSSLFEFANLAEILKWKAACHQRSIRLALAGSLRLEHWNSLGQISPDVVAIRGAACSSTRTSQLSSQKVQHWVGLMDSL